jgi:hypothetical protein
MECALTVRLHNPIERCSRCGAMMAVVERPEVDVEEFVAAATTDIVAGLEALLRDEAGEPEQPDSEVEVRPEEA